MPQPLSRVLKNPDFNFSGDALLKRPDLAPYVATIISIWSQCDTYLAEILSTFLKADIVIVNKMFQAVISPDARKAMLLAAAEHEHGKDSEDSLLIKAVLRATNASRERRNDFAHYLWGYTDQLPDGLLLLDPRYYASEIIAPFDEHIAKSISAQASGDSEIIEALRENPPEVPHIFEKIMVYRESDFISDLANAQLARIYFGQLAIALKPVHPLRDSMRSGLKSQPLIQPGLKKSK